VLQNDAFDDIAHAFAAICGVFQDLVKLLPFDQVNGIRRILEQLSHGAEIDIVRFVFKSLYLQKMRAHSLCMFQQVRRGTDLVYLLLQHDRQLYGVLVSLVNVVHYDRTPSGVDVIANVIKREPVMGGEDFSRYGREEPKIPIFMYRLGSIPAERIAESKKPGGKPLPSLHSAFYLPEPTKTIRTGVTTMTAAAIDLLQ